MQYHHPRQRNRFRRLAQSRAQRSCLNDVQPADVTWTVQGGEAELFAPPDAVSAPRRRTAPSTCRPNSSSWRKTAILHRDPERFAILYRLLWRLQDNHDLLRCRDRSRRRAGHGDGQGGASRRAQDACLRPLPRDRPRARVALRRLVRAGASHRRAGRAVLRQALCRHALVDPDAGPLRALGRPRALVHAGRQQERGAGRRPAGGNLAALLRQHLQSGAAEGEGDADGDAEEILEEPARGLVD